MVFRVQEKYKVEKSKGAVVYGFKQSGQESLRWEGDICIKTWRRWGVSHEWPAGTKDSSMPAVLR